MTRTANLATARAKAWETRRAKYGPRGHGGSYNTARPTPANDGALRLVIELHRDAVLSEGQVAAATGLDRVEIRRMVDELPEAAAALRQSPTVEEVAQAIRDHVFGERVGPGVEQAAQAIATLYGGEDE